MSSTIKVNNIQNLAGDDSGIDLSTNDQIILKTANTTAITVDSSQHVGIGTTSPDGTLHVHSASAGSVTANTEADELIVENNANGGISILTPDTARSALILGHASDNNKIQIRHDGNTSLGAFICDDTLTIFVGGSEVARIDTSGNLLVGTTSADSTSGAGARLKSGGRVDATVSGGTCSIMNRKSTDGVILSFQQDNTSEGTITVSGSTVSYNGGHLSRWSRLLNNSKDETIVKGTVMTNLDEMVEWSHTEVLWTKEDDLPDGVSVGDVKKSAYTEDNEQLNKMAVSSVEGDVNVAGVFVNWDDDDDFNDMNVAMTGDMVIRIAQGTTVARGDLLMSAGDGTAKPQDDDIVRSKTIAKVTSTNVSHTYDDGTYLVPCVLMAC